MEEPTDGYAAARYFNYFMVFIILLNVAVVMLETVQPVYTQFHPVFTFIDTVSVAIFTVEYILRMWVCVLHGEYRRPVLGRLKYAVTPFAIIDFLAFAPFYLPMILPVDLRFLRILRIFRVIRILKLGRYSASLSVFNRVLKRKKADLIVALSILFIAIIIASSLMYFAEHEAQPEAFSSIPHSMWWALVTLATVGYGDVFPVTPVGKVLGGIVVVVGIGVFALPTAIFVSGFMDETNHEEKVVCPKCGYVITDHSRNHDHERQDGGNDPEGPGRPS